MTLRTITGKSQGISNYGGGPALLANLDLATTVYLDNNSSVSKASPQLPPLGTMAIDGKLAWWASTVDGPSVQMQVIPGGTSWSPSAIQIAEQIALQGINVNIPGISALAPSGDISGATDTASIQSKLNNAAGNIVLLAGGTFRVNATITMTSGQYLMGAGKHATFINFVGNGDCIRVVDSSTYSTRTIHSGGVTDLTIDGSGATGTGNHGIHMGDIRSWRIDAGVRNFAGTNGVGVLFENAFFFTEWLHGRIEAENCAQAVLFTVSGAGTVSFDRADLDIYVIQGSASFDALVMINGAQIVHGRVTLRGNFTTAASGSAGRVIATSGGTAGIYVSQIEVGVECGGAGAVIPFTANFGAGTGIRQCTGIMAFLGDSPPAAFSQASPAGGQFLFTGPVFGDPTLGTTDYYGSFGQPNITANGQTFFTNQGSVIRITSAAAFTGLIVQAGQFDGQICHIVNSGGFQLTMAAAATSNVANGTACIVQPTSAVTLVWNATLALWFQVRQ